LNEGKESTDVVFIELSILSETHTRPTVRTQAACDSDNVSLLELRAGTEPDCSAERGPLRLKISRRQISERGGRGGLTSNSDCKDILPVGPKQRPKIVEHEEQIQKNSVLAEPLSRAYKSPKPRDLHSAWQAGLAQRFIMIEPLTTV
jgi:hypothetical protein